MELDSVEKILDFAITQEEKAAALYTELAEKSAAANVKDVFLEFAAEERGHKAKLLSIKSGKHMLAAEQTIKDMKIADYLKDVPISSDMDYQQALILAMQAEKAAFKLYTDLAAAAADPGLKETLLGLAQEEAKHKLRFELEYDEYVLIEN